MQNINPIMPINANLRILLLSLQPMWIHQQRARSWQRKQRPTQTEFIWNFCCPSNQQSIDLYLIQLVAILMLVQCLYAGWSLDRMPSHVKADSGITNPFLFSILFCQNWFLCLYVFFFFVPVDYIYNPSSVGFFYLFKNGNWKIQICKPPS